MLPTAIPAGELGERRARLLEHVRRAGAGAVVLFGPDYIRYFTNFWFLSNERPIVYVESGSGESSIFVPEFEVERTRAEATFERIESYPEYPGIEHPMRILARVLEDMGVGGKVAADQDGYPGILGYRGPTLSDAAGVEVIAVSDLIEQLMARKSPLEIELIRESGRWCARAHRLLQDYTRVGSTEAEAGLRAAAETTLEMLAERGAGGQLGSADGAKAGYRGQIGRRSSWAHAVAHNIEFQPGDLLVSETGAPILGYNAELERGMLIGPPADRARWLFEHAAAAQQVAFETVRPGTTCAEIDRAVGRYFEDNDLLPYWRQHTGHAIGLRNHEAPFLDLGDNTAVETGMVFTIEPGLYDPEIGGIRHSDTVAVTEDGIDILTDYPRDIESLTLPL